MEVEVLLFGQPRELAGKSGEILSVEENSTLNSLLVMLKEKYGKRFSEEVKGGEKLIILVNGRNHKSLAGIDTILKPGDTIAFLPMTFGG